MGFLSDLLSAGQEYKSAKRRIKRMEDFRGDMLERGTAVGEQGYEQSQFVPFSVTSSTGGIQGNAEGGFDMNLSEEQQAMQDRLFGMSGGFLDELGGDPLDRQKALYEQIRGIQSPEEERQRLELENRLRGQGRLGLMTAQYGGSPEQFAQALAQEQARNEAAYQAYGQSQADRQQAFGLASGLMGLGYVPQQQLGELYKLATPTASLAQSGRETGAALNVESMLKTLFDEQAGYGRSGLEIMGQQANKDDLRSGFWNDLLGTIESAVTAGASGGSSGYGGGSGGSLRA
jgi:hypothetical protein